ncbi:MAG TPA: molybdopterin-dependent oxidoreductase [Desulfosporosinus sp.]|nr:molybdopterin-dependent oxidoreductase [Desulfosporosinus sp.]
MSNRCKKEGNDLVKRLTLLHLWNALFAGLLALSGLMMFSVFWREALGDVQVWIKWLHIVIGLAWIVPVLSYLRRLPRHWKLLQGKPLQRVHVIVVLLLLLGWLFSGVLLWQFHAVGPAVANVALLVHDLLTLIGLPLIIYHSLTRLERFKQPRREQSEMNGAEGSLLSQRDTQPFYSRKTFIRTVIGAGLTISAGPSLLKWLGNLRSGKEFQKIKEEGTNKLLPAPMPLADSAPPIGGGASGSFRSYSVTPIPSFSNSDWSFTIDGLVEAPVTWNWKQFVALKRTVQVNDFHCVTGWSVYGNTWEGIPLKTLLEKVRVKGQAKVVKLYSGDGVYTDSLTLEQVGLDDVMVAVMHDGKPISDDLGGPVRIIIPKMYAYKSVKWLNRIELIEEVHIGYWGERGYEQDAWVKG